MALVSQLASQVPGDVRRRGRQYFARGLVRIGHGNAWSVEAKVQGTTRYRVRLARDPRSLTVWCSCPYYQGHHEACKHIWATVLAAEARGYLRGSGGSHGLLRLALDHRGAEREDVGGGHPHRPEGQGPHRGRPRGGEGHPNHGGRPRGGDGRGPNGPRHPSDRGGPRPAYPPNQPQPQGQRPPDAGQHQQGRKKRKKGRRRGEWKKPLPGINGQPRPDQRREDWTSGREVLYVVDVPATQKGRGVTVDIGQRTRRKPGGWNKPRFERMHRPPTEQLPDPADRQIFALLAGAERETGWAWQGPGGLSPFFGHAPRRYRLSEPLRDMLLPIMCRTGRCRLRLRERDEELRPLVWDEGDAWEFWLEITRDDLGKHYRVGGVLRRGLQRLELSTPSLLLPGGLVFWNDRVGRLEDFGAFELITLLRKGEALTVPTTQSDDILTELVRLPRLPRLALPPELHFEEVVVAPRPRLRVRPPDRRGWGLERLHADLSFDYDGTIVLADQPGRGFYQSERRRLIVRDEPAERAAQELLQELGFKAALHYYTSKPELELAPRYLDRAIHTLLEAGWDVEAEGKVYRRPGEFKIEVTSGIDWFELHGRVSFGDQSANLPELLAALKRGDDMVRLGDGSFGMLPQEWLKKYGLLAGLGQADGEHLRFSRAQVGVLDALLASQPGATYDLAFEQAREALRRFAGVEATDPPTGFVGQLRAYQRDGLGWLTFLEKFGFGGCLADDMGLGKTVQVLALLESRRALREAAAARTPAPAKEKSEKRGRARAAEAPEEATAVSHVATEAPPEPAPGPSLVVVPKSLVFNWKQETARFTPAMRVLDHTGTSRTKDISVFNDYDVVLTTYGTLRRDAVLFKDARFDYCILDEAQAIKNATTESAKAVRLLRGDHRLALSGTPVENHLGELWSLFEFLNPGMLGSASVFKLGGAGARNPDEETRTLLARALRPFILRRTKDQVAKDLPAKSEQTLYCELEPAQRRRYDELREHYRQALLSRVERDGLSRSKMLILEALLRLRQAACHPGLIDKTKASEPSAKLDALLPQLAEVVEEGHKVLVFSQFTTFLGIVRDRLDQEGITYEYLDGRTRNRQERVERFQNDPDCKLFLISLKAGGLGLNLTAAEYVYLLDPWWNPAVEAQAIDRTHRIGQERPVFAYRLIARDTVEEKVLELQQSKRALADAIINADNSLIRDLKREDLELLLS